MDIRDKQFNLAEWNTIIEDSLVNPDSEPLFNLAGEDAAMTPSSWVAALAVGSVPHT